eukprot:scaffold153286_cov32-Tisochrysis_lutea.AAC.3
MGEPSSEYLSALDTTSCTSKRSSVGSTTMLSGDSTTARGPTMVCSAALSSMVADSVRTLAYGTWIASEPGARTGDERPATQGVDGDELGIRQNGHDIVRLCRNGVGESLEPHARQLAQEGRSSTALAFDDMIEPRVGAAIRFCEVDHVTERALLQADS